MATGKPIADKAGKPRKPSKRAPVTRPVSAHAGPQASQSIAPAQPRRDTCALTGHVLPKRDLIDLDVLRPRLSERILADHPGLAPHAHIGRDEVVRYRRLYAEELLTQERGELSALERDVAKSLESEMLISDNVELSFNEKRTLGQRMADGVASFGGSWVFIAIFGVFLVFWMSISVAQRGASFDPYPFILLNLILSCLAAIQAPIIMMSQKRLEAKDRARSQNDYRINLKAELEIRHLHEKLDHLLSRQWERLAELQQLEIEIMEENTKRARQ